MLAPGIDLGAHPPHLPDQAPQTRAMLRGADPPLRAPRHVLGQARRGSAGVKVGGQHNRLELGGNGAAATVATWCQRRRRSISPTCTLRVR
jgi:hypothetical protein